MKVHEKLQTTINPRGLLVGLFLLLAFQSARAANFVVTNVADSGPGSLREAITLANANPGPDLIRFVILPVAGVKTIVLHSHLPAITDTVTIDGWSQGGRGLNTTPRIELRGNSRVRLLVGLQFGSSDLAGNAGTDSLVRGLIINGFSHAGIEVDGALRVTVLGRYIGTNANGDTAEPNAGGIVLIHAFNCQIGGPTARDRNVISGNQTGIQTIMGADNVIEGNYIGLSASGLSPLGNEFGVVISDPSGDLVGGPEAGRGNVISGNSSTGIRVQINCADTRIEGNYIGTTPDGMTAMANQVGIDLQGDYNTIIGGADAATGNVISGNSMYGILAEDSHSSIIQNNLIGVASDRTTPLGNQAGIVSRFGSNMKIGGSVHLRHLRFITAVPAGNIIAFNAGAGVGLFGGGGNLISLNQIHDNGGLGIDLDGDGVTANDECDADSGANGLQNFPIISTASSVNGNTTIIGHLNSAANTPYRIEFFTNPSCDPSGNGEGAVYLGSILVSTPQNDCDAGFTATFNTALPPNTVITATAIHPSGDTSEFSPCVFVSAGPQ